VLSFFTLIFAVLSDFATAYQTPNFINRTTPNGVEAISIFKMAAVES